MEAGKEEKTVPLDTLHSTTQFSPTCSLCKHITYPPGTCKAFQGGIPEAIWLGSDGHEDPRPGDGGVTFELADGVAPAVASRFNKRRSA